MNAAANPVDPFLRMPPAPARPSRMRLLTLCVLGMMCLTSVRGANPPPASDITPAWLTQHLTPAHPRLLWPRQSNDALRAEMEADPIRAALLKQTLANADALLSVPPVTYQKEGRRLLAVSREALQRVLTLAAIARLTGDGKYAARAERELLAVAAFNDWNPSHFLDVAEMTAAVAFGYDWLYDQLTPATRATLRTAIVDKGIDPSFNSRQHWVGAPNNWAQVCHGGLTLGALAIADELPEPAARVVSRAVENLPRPMAFYEPDGAYPEGPNYWNYGTSYNVLLLAALQSALGTDFRLTDAPAFRRTLDYLEHVTAPSGTFYNYADNGVRRRAQTSVVWLARLTGNTPALERERERLGKELATRSDRGTTDLDRLRPLLLLWSGPLAGTNTAPLPLGWMGRGVNPVAVQRSAWNDPAATFTGIKGGSPSGPHGHVDTGSFVLESDGVRWAEEFGGPNYHRVETSGVNLWSPAPDSERWTILEISAASHNLLTFNGDNLDTTQAGPIVRFSAHPTNAHAVIDTTPVHRKHATRSLRGLAWQPDGRILIQDDLEGVAAGTSVRWAMLTRADIKLKGSRATLTRDGKQLTVDFSEAPNVELGIVSLDKVEGKGNAPRPGYRLLTATVKSPGPQLFRLAALFTPGSITSPAPPLHFMSPTDWSAPLP